MPKRLELPSYEENTYVDIQKLKETRKQPIISVNEILPLPQAQKRRKHSPIRRIKPYKKKI